ncbi:MAG TPA: DNA primase [Candidatus Polarisedimenticolia bacterium]|nr:DNA primase [Candidatus Polarisedimenticolia bacterium]
MASPLAPDFVDRVRGAVDIVALVSECVPLKKSGRKFRGLCPFHPEKTPSFYVDDGKGLFYCFGCHAGGDAFKFVMLREHVEFVEAAKILARRLGVAIPETRQAGKPSEREALLAAHAAAAEFYHDTLKSRPEAAPARKYLVSRGVTPETAARLGIGFAPDRWDGLKGHLVAKGFSAELLVTGGLLVRAEGRQTTYDRFRNRLMFPIKSLSGDVVAFGGRLLGPGEPKYLNSSDSPIYNKRENLYGLHLTREGIREAGEAVVVEGYFDFASLWQAGVTHAAATCGTAFSEEQAALLRRFTERVVINYDPDAAGAAATRRGIDLLLGRGFKVRVLRLDAGLDPDAFVRGKGADEYRARLGAAARYFDYLLESAAEGEDLSSYETKSAVLKKILPVLELVPDRIERSGYVNVLAERLGIEDATMLAEIKDALVKGARRRPAQPAPPPPPMKVPEADGRLVRALMERGDVRDEVLEILADEDVAGTPIDEIVRVMRGRGERGEEVSYPVLSELLREPSRTVLARLAMRPEPVVSREEALRCAESIRLRRLRVERDRIQKEMERERDAARLDDLMRRKVEVSRQIDSLS